MALPIQTASSSPAAFAEILNGKTDEGEYPTELLGKLQTKPSILCA